MRKIIAALFLTCSTSAFAEDLSYFCSYETTIERNDKFNSSGMDLRSLPGKSAIAAILRQNRANEVRTLGRRAGSCLASKEDRAGFEKLIKNSRISANAANAILHEAPRIRVKVYYDMDGREDYVEVEMLPKKRYSGEVR